MADICLVYSLQDFGMAYTTPGTTRDRVFRFVRNELYQGRSPTIREVQSAMGFRAVETARSHLQALVAEGRLLREAGRARGYRLPDGSGRRGATVLVPLLGRVQAGDLQPALETHEGQVAVQTHLPAEELFALTVEGESMTGAGILPGDVVVVHRRPTAESGEIVVALVDQEATVKTLRLQNGVVELHPHNPLFQPICPPPDDLRILGKVIEIRRYLD